MLEYILLAQHSCLLRMDEHMQAILRQTTVAVLTFLERINQILPLSGQLTFWFPIIHFLLNVHRTKAYINVRKKEARE